MISTLFPHVYLCWIMNCYQSNYVNCVISWFQVSQIRIAFAPVATALHCKRSCARENVSVRDMPVSEEMWSSQVVIELERLQEGSGGYPSPEAQQIVRMLDAGTSRLNLATWPNNPDRRVPTMLMILSKPDVAATVTFVMKLFHSDWEDYALTSHMKCYQHEKNHERRYYLITDHWNWQDAA